MYPEIRLLIIRIFYPQICCMKFHAGTFLQFFPVALNHFLIPVE